MMSCEKKPDFVERSGKIYNYFTGKGEPDVKVCSRYPSACAITNEEGIFNIIYESNQYLFDTEYKNGFFTNYICEKNNVNFYLFLDDSSGNIYAVGKTWVRIHINSDAPFTDFYVKTYNASPIFDTFHKIPGISYEGIVEIVASDLVGGRKDKWWQDLEIGARYINENSHEIIRKDTINLIPLDTVDAYFNF